MYMLLIDYSWILASAFVGLLLCCEYSKAHLKQDYRYEQNWMFFPLHRTIAPRGLKLIMKVRPNAFQLAVIFYLGRKKKKKR